MTQASIQNFSLDIQYGNRAPGGKSLLSKTAWLGLHKRFEESSPGVAYETLMASRLNTELEVADDEASRWLLVLQQWNLAARDAGILTRLHSSNADLTALLFALRLSQVPPVPFAVGDFVQRSGLSLSLEICGGSLMTAADLARGYFARAGVLQREGAPCSRAGTDLSMTLWASSGPSVGGRLAQHLPRNLVNYWRPEPEVRGDGLYEFLGTQRLVGIPFVDAAPIAADIRIYRPATFLELMAFVSFSLGREIDPKTHVEFLARRPAADLPEFAREHLRETHGRLIDREQSCEILMSICGCDLTRADKLRRGLRLKRPAAAIELSKALTRKGLPGRTHHEIHSWLSDAAYSRGLARATLVGVAHYILEGAFLKCHFPVEFESALAQDALARGLAT